MCRLVPISMALFKRRNWDTQGRHISSLARQPQKLSAKEKRVLEYLVGQVETAKSVISSCSPLYVDKPYYIMFKSGKEPDTGSHRNLGKRGNLIRFIYKDKLPYYPETETTQAWKGIYVRRDVADFFTAVHEYSHVILDDLLDAVNNHIKMSELLEYRIVSEGFATFHEAFTGMKILSQKARWELRPGDEYHTRLYMQCRLNEIRSEPIYKAGLNKYLGLYREGGFHRISTYLGLTRLELEWSNLKQRLRQAPLLSQQSPGPVGH